MWFREHILKLDRYELRSSASPICFARVPGDINNSYHCDRAQGHDGLHVSWWDHPDENYPVEVWGEGITEEMRIIARLL